MPADYGAFDEVEEHDPDAPPRPVRPLRVDTPQVHLFHTSDRVELRLMRYRGGPKGPVVLSHCIGVSGRMYTTDTIDTNLLEHLFAAGYDVWVLDHRLSIELVASHRQSTMDDVATKDYPAAVEKVRELAGAESVQMVAHGVGSSTFTMAMLAGLEGVRAAVCSQVSTHLFVPPLVRAMARLRLPQALRWLGARHLTAYTDRHSSWPDRLYNLSLRLYPRQQEEQCRNPVCHRITSIYGPLYEHDQMDRRTHRALHEMFGVVNLRALTQLSLMSLKTHLVDAAGRDAYLPHLKRLAIPIAFLHGADNECVLPPSTERTIELLGAANDPRLYSRHVIPDYGHVDCMFGKNAVHDVFPLIAAHLDESNE